MDIKLVHKFEQTVVGLLNALDGWELNWTGEDYSHCDAVGLTPKGRTCAIEMKFRKKYYDTKMLEQYKYDKLMEMEQEVKLFWLNDIVMPTPQDMWCPDTTLWTSRKTKKPCYLLKEEQAAIVNIV